MRLAWLLVAAVVAGCQCGPQRDTDAGADAGAGVDAGSDDDGGDAGPFDAGDPDAGPCGSLQWVAPAPCTATTLEGKLGCVPGLHFARGMTTVPGATRYDLTFTQAVDHDDRDAGTFNQRAMLLVVDEAAPMVLQTSGYSLTTGRSELTRTFETNQLSYEHRFFTPSRPVPADWSKLTIRQAAADAHELVKALRWIFPGRWVSTGGSKGGMTSLYHRRFYTCDVDATVAYVAPVSFGTADPAYSGFLSAVGGARWAACRTGLGEFQRRLLTARQQLVPQVPGTFTTIGGADRAFELAVVELNFAFWQYTAPDDPTWGCAAIPGPSATQTEMLDFLAYHSAPADLADDATLEFFAPYYYQASTQLGGPAPYEAPLTGLLAYPGADVAPTYIPGVPLAPFEPAAMTDVDDWLAQSGERVMLIDGELDPWSTHRIPLGNAVDSFAYLAPGGNHAARLGTLAQGDQARALSTLERWLRVPVVNAPPVRAGAPEDLEPRWPR